MISKRNLRIAGVMFVAALVSVVLTSTATSSRTATSATTVRI